MVETHDRYLVVRISDPALLNAARARELGLPLHDKLRLDETLALLAPTYLTAGRTT